jgi:hypothetical protein
VRKSELSDATGPRATTVGNPFPAPSPTLPSVTVLWTAQPDAAGHARTVLSWPAVPGASGYVVWEATEAALSNAVGGAVATGPIRDRAANLKLRVAGSYAKSLAAFSRLNERPLQDTTIELVLPGSADTLYAYRLSSTTTQNMDSARTTEIVLVGVPHRDVPGTPRLEARVSSVDRRVTLTVIPGSGRMNSSAGAVLTPAALRIHRVRREALADQIGTMGPPVFAANTAGLPLVTVPALSGPVETGWQFEDTVAASWVPYYYRCVTLGRDAPDDGLRAGESPPSGTIRVLVPPHALPRLIAAPRQTGLAGMLLQFSTDLPYLPTPAGEGWLTIATLVGPTRTVLARLASTAIQAGPPLRTLGRPPAAILSTRSAAVAGVINVSVLIPPGPRIVVPPGTRTPPIAIVVTATDPLGRSTMVEV